MPLGLPGCNVAGSEALPPGTSTEARSQNTFSRRHFLSSLSDFSLNSFSFCLSESFRVYIEFAAFSRLGMQARPLALYITGRQSYSRQAVEAENDWKPSEFLITI